MTYLNYRENYCGKIFIADCIFVICSAIYAFLAYKGIILLSANGTILDSDLQTYAQGMTGAAFPDNFISDPVLNIKSEANSIKNVQRYIAESLAADSNYGLALLKAGSIAVFFFYCLWYALGRFLFKAPSLAALLALCSGITVWVGWGTFWGLTHSDPVPRVFFGAIFPLLLILALKAYKFYNLRPFAMLACGLAMWIHGISALNCGAMFFSAFFFCKPAEKSFKNHFFNTLLNLIAFLTPVCIFLWPSLSQHSIFSESDLQAFTEMQNLRWQEDYSNYWERLLHTFSPANPIFFISLAGCASWIAVYLAKNTQYKILLKIIPAFLPGLFAVAFIAWLEPQISSFLHRPAMGHELIRGLRFLVPLSWLLIIAATACYSSNWQRKTILCIVFFALIFLNQDRQHLAAESALANILHISLPEKAQTIILEAEKEKAVLEKISEIVPENESIFCIIDNMPIRYVAKRTLAHSFKDGYVFFYNKDAANTRKWLAIEKALSQGSEGIIKAWKLSEASWLLVPAAKAQELMHIFKANSPALYQSGWMLFNISELAKN